jgi:hypothetical protein
MLKTYEATNHDSCWNRARNDELVFVLLGRDVAAPAAIRAWIRERIRTGKNQPDDAQIAEAFACANAMKGAQKAGQCAKSE